jgi:hypothetical protein
MVDADPPTVTFDCWVDPVIDSWGIDPASSYSRSGWLPIIGPSSWLVWSTVAEQLRHEHPVTWRLEDLAQAHGLGSRIVRSSPIVRTLVRLQQFYLVRATESGLLLVRMSVPPLTRRQLARLPSFVAQLHRDVFETPRWPQAQ